MSHATALSNRDAFTIAREITTQLGKAEHTHLNFTQVQKCVIPAPTGVNIDDSALLAATNLVKTAISAALGNKSSEEIHVITGQDSVNGPYVKFILDNQQEKIEFPAKATQAKLDEIKASLSDPKNWAHDADGNHRHSVTFDKFGKHGFKVQQISASLLKGNDVEIYRPTGSSTTNLADFVKSNDGGRYADGIVLSSEQLRKTSKILGFMNPEIKK